MQSYRTIIFIGLFTATLLSVDGFKVPNSFAIGNYDEGKTTTYFFVVAEKLSDFKYEYSKQKEIEGVKWEILTQKIEDYLGLFVYADEGTIGEKSFTVDCIFKLISRGDKKPETFNFTDREFNKDQLNYGIPKFIKWDDLKDANNKYSLHDAAIFEMELVVKKK